MSRVSKVFLNRINGYVAARPAIPDDQVGRFRVEHKVKKAGECVTLVSLRSSFFTGLPETRVTYDYDLVIRSLVEDKGGALMTDSPQELVQLDDAIRAARGKVLVGGLGLGCVASLMAQREEVREVTVVEIEKDAIDLVRPHLDPNIRVIHGDLYEYLRSVKKGDYSFGYFDIWSPTGEWTWVTNVVPLRRLAVRAGIPRVFCWAEEEMTGQVAMALLWAASMPAEDMEGKVSMRHYWTFRKGIEQERPEAPLSLMPGDSEEDRQRWLAKRMEVEQANRLDEALRPYLILYLNAVGTPLWEKVFGQWWDQASAWKTEA